MKKILITLVCLLFFLPFGIRAASLIHKFYDVRVLNNLSVDNTLTAETAVIGDVNITGTLTGAGATAYRGVFARANTDSTITTGAVYTIPLQQEIYDTDNVHSTTTDNAVFRIPSGVTKVSFYGQLYFFDNGPSDLNMVSLKIVKNGTDFDPPCRVDVTPSTGSKGLRAIQIVSPVVEVVAGDNISLCAWQSESNTVTFYGADFSGQGTWFAMDIVQ